MTVRRVAGAVGLAVLLGCGGTAEDGGPASTTLRRPAELSRPISMLALHRQGGVPAGWRFAVPPGDPEAGRRTFVDLGCGACHAVVGTAAASGGVGPELTGMGSHHPPEYFAEAILNPDAVLVEGPGYLGPDGRSVMPVYPDLTLAQLADLVAFLGSLVGPGGAHAGHAAPAVARPATADSLPPPPRGEATVYFVQSYRVRDGALADFERWWAKEGAAAFRAFDGLVSVDTWVDRTNGPSRLTSVFGFRNHAALNRFTTEPAAVALGEKFDGFVGEHDHQIFSSAPLYRVEGLSLAAAAPPPLGGGE